MSFMNSDYLAIVGSSLAVYAFMVLAIRLFGKKELSQLSVIDLVFILLISNAVQNAMVGNNSTLLGGLVAASALFIFNFILKQAIFRFPFLSKFIQGEPIMLVYKGNIKIDNMHSTRITYDELVEASREHGVETIADVDLAILEIDGNISILSKNFTHKTSRKRKVHRMLQKDF